MQHVPNPTAIYTIIIRTNLVSYTIEYSVNRVSVKLCILSAESDIHNVVTIATPRIDE